MYVMETFQLLLTIACAVIVAWAFLSDGWNFHHAWTSSDPISSPKPPILTRTEPSEPSKESSSTISAAPLAARAQAPFKKSVAVRVRGIHTSNVSEAETLIRTTIEHNSSEDEWKYIISIDLVPSCTHPGTLMALVDMMRLPAFLRCLQQQNQESYLAQTPDGYYLNFDINFLGFTQMYPTESEPEADIVLLSGIGSHAYGSWRSKTEPCHMWPRHFLRQSFPNVRVMIYGHKASLTGVGFGHLLDYSRSFGHELELVRQDQHRQIVFVAHSFGGNILKSFLVDDKRNNSQTLLATRGILFFAVPHRGIDVQDMMQTIKYSDTSQTRLGQISQESYWRGDLDNFINIIKGCKIASFYEMELTRRLKANSDGTFARIGEYVQVLEPESATLQLPNDMESKHPVDADHSSIVKFEHENISAFTQTLQCLRSFFSDIKASTVKHDEATVECLKELQVTDPEQDLKRIESAKDDLITDCSAWILDNPLLQQWRKQGSQPVLWINGDPGKGKTMLMISLIRVLQSISPENPFALAFFFCQSADPRLNNAVSILRGLIWKLAIDHPRLATVFCEQYSSQGCLFDGPNAIYSLFSVLTRMAEESEVIILIDGLDECNPGPERDELLGLIAKNAKSSSQVKWLLCSRNNIEIRRFMREGSLTLSLELNDDLISEAVNVYISYKIDQIAQEKDYDAALKYELKRRLSEKANSTFLWVALACKTLEKLRWRGKALSSLEKLPSGLEPFYSRMMEEILQSETDERDMCLRILYSMVIALRPLSLEELAVIADLPEDPGNFESLEEIVGLCGSFVAKRQGIAYFVHQSAKDFLTLESSQGIFDHGVKKGQGNFVHRLLSVMNQTLESDMGQLGFPGASVNSAILPARFSAIKYACCFWVDHLCSHFDRFSESTPNSEIYTEFLRDKSGAVHEFLSLHLLHWFEALSLINEVSAGVHALQQLQKIIKPHESKELHGFVYDATRVVLQCRRGIEEAPLQIYSSALIFAPNQSIVRKLFLQKIKWLEVLPEMQDDWDAVLQTLEGHTELVSSVTFSPNGEKLASASNDKTVRVWDAETGALQQVLKGKDQISCVNFSPDGQRLVASSCDTLQVWEVVTGVLHQTLESHAGQIYSVAYSPDGQMLASSHGDNVQVWNIETGVLQQTFFHTGTAMSVVFSNDGQLLASTGGYTTCIWDVETGALQQTLNGHTAIVRSVMFSSDDQRLVSASDDKTVRLWDTNSGVLQQTLNGDTKDSISSITFSANGQQLLSGSGGNIQIWHVETGALKQTFNAHNSEIWSVACSLDGRWLASAGDKELKIWEAGSGKLLHSLEGHARTITSVAFSPDSQLLASGSHDGSVRIWHSATGTLQHVLTDSKQMGSCTSIAFSSDSQRLVSGSFKLSILWDVETGAPQQTIKGDFDWILSAAFSLDGKYLALATRNGKVFLLDAKTGTLQRTLEGHFGWVWSVAFSPDSRWVASAASSIVMVWDTATGSLQHTLSGHMSTAKSVSFSPDSRLVASGSLDKTLRMWDVKTGILQQALKGETGLSWSVAFSPNGERLISGAGNRVQVWDSITGTLQRTLKGHSDQVTSVTFSPDGHRLASASADKTIRVWDAKVVNTLKERLIDHPSRVTSMTFSPNGEWLVSTSDDNSMRVWDAKSGVLKQMLTGGSKANFSSDCQQLTTGGIDRVQLWNIKSGVLHRNYQGHSRRIRFTAFSPNGQQLASSSDDKTVRLWNSQTDETQQILKGHEGSIYSLAFSPSGKRLASASTDKTILIWNTTNGELWYVLMGHTDAIVSVAFSSDGQWLASASDDMTVRLWDAESGMIRHILNGHMGKVRSVSFSPDNQLLASVADDRTVRLWDVKTGVLQEALNDQANCVPSVMFSSDNSQLFTGCGTYKLRLPMSQPAPNSTFVGCGIGKDENWITWNGKNVMWLPLKYRPCIVSIDKQILAVGCNSGFVYVVSFSGKVLSTKQR